ncbi:hypothetical protein KJ997_01240 [bacterium]|nr:hypothetical protein [bacterium]
MIKKFIKIFILIVISFLLASPSFAQKKPIRMAIIDLDAQGVPQEIANSLAEVLRSAFVGYPEFEIIEYSKMREILKTQAFQQTGSTDTASMTELGKILNAQKVVLGSINAIGKKYLIVLRVVDVELGKIEMAHTEELICELEELTTLVRNTGIGLANKILGVLPVEKPAAKEIKEIVKKEGPVKVEEKAPQILKMKIREGAKTKGIAFARSFILPGWGQFYKRHYFKGSAILIIDTIAILGAIDAKKKYTTVNKEYQEAQKKYDQMVRENYPFDQFLSDDLNIKYQEAKDASKNIQGPMTIGIIVYAYNLIDSLLGFPLPEDIIYTTKNTKDWNLSLDLLVEPKLVITKKF